MPFLSKDWRSPGEEWVRYEGGWELKKTVPLNSLHHQSFFLLSPTNSPTAPRKLLNELSDNISVKMDIPIRRRKLISEPSFLSEADDDDDDDDEEEEEEEEKRLLSEFLKTHNVQLHPVGMDNSQLHNNNNNNNNSHDHNINMPPNGDDEENINRKSHHHNSSILLRLDKKTQPFCTITVKCTKEVAGFNKLADALLRLDMIQAVKDTKRFHYVSQLMYVLFCHDKLNQLPGSAQKILFRMLEEMADYVHKTNQNQHVLKKLMQEIHTTMTIYHVWGSHLGSTRLFKQHAESRRKITEFVEKMQVEFKQDLASPGMVDCLPEECIREILLRLSDAHDVERASQACLTMNSIAKEKRIWRELVQTHFTKHQIEFILEKSPNYRDKKDWKKLYEALRRKFGLTEKFTEVIVLCRKCHALFWQSIGHPCLVSVDTFIQLLGDSQNNDQLMEPSHIPLSPQAFLSFFSV